MIKTPWGYSLTQATSMPSFITGQDFASFTNGKFSITDMRISANIPAATLSVQNYCGWHIYPNLECEMVYRAFDLRDSLVGSDLLIQLPATFVTAITQVLLNAELSQNEWTGDETTDFDLSENGILRLYDVPYLDKRSKIRIVYNAGLGDDQMSLIKELVANKVTHALTNSYGVASEAAGGVSVSYNSSWTGRGSSALTDDSREILDAYRVKGVY